MDEDVRRWRPKGTVYFWFEADKRQGDGWHLAANERGCQDLCELIALGKSSPYPARFTLPLGSVAGSAVSKLLVSYDARWLPDHWKITPNHEEVLWELGTTSFDRLCTVAADLKRGEVDYAIGGEEAAQRVWLWWPPSK